MTHSKANTNNKINVSQNYKLKNYDTFKKCKNRTICYNSNNSVRFTAFTEMEKYSHFFILIFNIPSSNFSQFGGGDGLTEATAFKIYTKAHLEELADSAVWNMNPNFTTGKYFKLMNDITDTVTIPIPYFMGTFDGQNYTVSMNIYIGPVNRIGLFRVIINSTVKNLRVTGLSRGGSYVGSIVGQAETSHILNCHSSVFIKFNMSSAGGIAGRCSGSVIANCSNTGTIEQIGIGSHYPSATINGMVGGIVGFVLDSSVVLNCFNAGLIKGTPSLGGALSNYGGIVGRGPGNFSNNVNVGVVIGGENVGCIVGETVGGNAVLENNYYDKQMCVCCEE